VPGSRRLGRPGAGLGSGGRGIRAPLAGLRQAACQAGAAAIFAFPLRIGAIRAGVLGLYRERPGPLTACQLGDALIFADAATVLLLDAQDQAGGDLLARAGPGGQPADLALHRAEIDPGHRDAHRAARRRPRGRIRAAARLCLFQ
jgi:hypothetical protein